MTQHSLINQGTRTEESCYRENEKTIQGITGGESATENEKTPHNTSTQNLTQPLQEHPRQLGLGSFLCFIALILLTASTILASPQINSNEIDQLTLLEIKAKMIDPANVLSSWNESSDFCQWYGITCSRRHRRVTILSLQSLNLSGTMSPHIGNLSFLRELYLYNNSFTFSIPSQVGSLSRLKKLFLYNNSFEGHIPSNLSHCTNLLNVHLGHNNLEGGIPKELSFLIKLQELVLKSNSLIGNIPSTFGNLSSLRIFAVQYNKLGNNIPDTLGQLRNLNHLFLSGNKFVGMFPSSIFNISSITKLCVAENELEGSLPSNLGFTLPILEILNLGSNHFTGPIPMSISNASNLLNFRVMKNSFTGGVPSFAKMRKLQRFSIGENSLGIELHGDLNFLCSLTNSTSLQKLGIERNNFGDSIPDCIGNLSITLQLLSMNENYISRSLPNSIGNLINLETLDLSGNHISGYIPSVIGTLNQLKVMDFGENEFSGQIPQSLGYLSMLTKLLLCNNHLQGSISSSLGELESLLLLNLSNNNLSGSIPSKLISLSSLSIYLDLSMNNLTGTIPKEVRNLKHLGKLYLDNNRLSGEIPSSIGKCTSMEDLYLQDNFFEGPLPSTLSSLRGIQVLNFSNNRLSGQIPRFLESLNLLNLSLSYNDFEGALPTKGVFRSIESTSIVGNKKLCGGLPIFQLPKCDFKESHVTRRSGTPRVVIVSMISTFMAIACILFFLYFFWYKHNKKGTISCYLEDGLLKVSYHSLLKATNGFATANLIDVGNFGSVYKGFLVHIQTIVAIKVLDLAHHGASKSFIAECEALRKIRHRNLVKVLTVCSGIDFSGNDFKALVYEFMVGGNLDKWLHPTALENEAPQALNLLARVNIAIDVAYALDYLHHHCETPIVHCDLKPNNILLDKELVAHVGDFGLARFLPEGTHKLLIDQTSSIGVKGSFGYIAPEYGLGSKASTCGDVYSYGVLILEMFTGKRPTDVMFQNGLNLHAFAKVALAGQVEKMIDPLLTREVKEFQMDRNIISTNMRNIEESLISIIQIGVICSSESPRDRMNIVDVLTTLEGIKKKLLHK